MANITVFNKGKRPWNLIDYTGRENRVNPAESIIMEESKGKRIIADYPRDFTTSGPAVIDNTELQRREQSVKDKERSLKEREVALDEREKEIGEREKAAESRQEEQKPEPEQPKKHAGRPPKNAEK
jgi:hypothetical protein